MLALVYSRLTRPRGRPGGSPPARRAAAGKWSYLVLEQLHIGTMRFNELQRALGVSTKSLTDTLRHPEAHGIVR